MTFTGKALKFLLGNKRLDPGEIPAIARDSWRAPS
jgi:hypothetical protein